MTDTIYEFRDYTLHAGQRDVLIDIFERHLIEAQETLGANVRAIFRDLDDPSRFIWIRSFADAHARFAALDAFYTGATWREHRGAANATMIDSDNVLQLRPVAGAIPTAARPAVAVTEISHSVVVATTFFPKAEVVFSEHFLNETSLHLREVGAPPFAAFATEHTQNAYPRLPIRDETVFMTLSRFASSAAYDERREAIDAVYASLGHLLAAPTQMRRLRPTARSTLR